MSEMQPKATDLEFEKIRATAKSYAAWRGQPYYSEDFASFVTLYMIEHNLKNPYFARRWIDFLRREQGRDAETRKVRQRTIPLEKHHIPQKLENFSLPEKRPTTVTLKQLATLVLMNYGFSSAEIAEVYQVTAQAVDGQKNRALTNLKIRKKKPTTRADIPVDKMLMVYLREALIACDGNKTLAAQRIGRSVRWVRYMSKYLDNLNTSAAS